MKIEIKDIAYHLPEKVVTSEDLLKENPAWDIDLLQKRVGVYKRHIADDNETALDLAFCACKKLLSKNKGLGKLIDGIIFCTESGDHIAPPNACILHKMLDLSDNVLAFDYNLACSGYIYGLALARGLIFSGMAKNILLVNADTYSKYINKQDRSVRMLFGDGAAVSWITVSNTKKGIIDIQCATYGGYYDKFIIPAGGLRMPKSDKTGIPMHDESGNIRTLENICMDGMGILSFVNSKVPKQINSILKRNRLKIDNMDLFVFHQASKMTLDSHARILKISNGKMYQNLDRVGNTVSASIPIALQDSIMEKRLHKGDKVLISGFGVGLSWGSAIIEM